MKWNSAGGEEPQIVEYTSYTPAHAAGRDKDHLTQTQYQTQETLFWVGQDYWRDFQNTQPIATALSYSPEAESRFFYFPKISVLILYQYNNS